MDKKICTRCKCELDRSMFYGRKASKDGLMVHCKKCDDAKKKKYFEENQEKIKEKRAKFYSKNREKILKRQNQYSALNRDRESLRSAEWRAIPENREKYLKWRSDNYEILKVKTAFWVKENAGRVNSRTRVRQGTIKQAIPKWANKQAIIDFYEYCVALRRETGIDYTVDHIVPLKSEYVCGLHVENNFTILTRGQNATKCNRTWPDMW